MGEAVSAHDTANDTENKKNEISDIELINCFKAGDEHAFSLLAERYFWLIRTITSKYKITGFDRDDLIQEGMLGLFSAVKAYDKNREASFKTFASLCISHRIIKLFERSDNIKGSSNIFISLDDSSINAEKLIAEYLPSGENDTDPEELYICKENISSLKKRITDMLSKKEKQVFDLYITGESYGDIAKQLGITVKSVDNAIQRIRTKINKRIN